MGLWWASVHWTFNFIIKFVIILNKKNYNRENFSGVGEQQRFQLFRNWALNF